jgi:hypothetical protein
MASMQSTTVSGVAASAALCPDTTNAADATGVFVKVGAGSTVTVQFTADDPAGASPVWFATGVAALTAITANAAALLPCPCRAVRLNQTVAGADSTLQIVNTGRI